MPFLKIKLLQKRSLSFRLILYRFIFTYQGPFTLFLDKKVEECPTAFRQKKLLWEAFLSLGISDAIMRNRSFFIQFHATASEAFYQNLTYCPSS